PLAACLGVIGAFFFQAEDGIRDRNVTGVQTCALPICTFTAALTEPETLASLEMVQSLFTNATAYALDSQASQKAFEKYFNESKVGAMIGTGNVGTKIDQALWDEDKVGVMALPSDTPGQVGQTFAGGSNISLAANAQNPELGREALKIIFSEEFQTLIAEAGWSPGNSAYGDSVE